LRIVYGHVGVAIAVLAFLPSVRRSFEVRVLG